MTPKTMKLIARILLAIVAFFMLTNGLSFMFNPHGAMEGVLVSAQGNEGLSNVRAFWGGAITAIGICTAIAAYTLNISDARPAALFTIMLVVARMTGLLIDGHFDKIIIYTIVPIVVFLILLTAHKLLDKANAAEAA